MVKKLMQEILGLAFEISANSKEYKVSVCHHAILKSFDVYVGSDEDLLIKGFNVSLKADKNISEKLIEIKSYLEGLKQQ